MFKTINTVVCYSLVVQSQLSHCTRITKITVLINYALKEETATYYQWFSFLFLKKYTNSWRGGGSCLKASSNQSGKKQSDESRHKVSLQGVNLTCPHQRLTSTSHTIQTKRPEAVHNPRGHPNKNKKGRKLDFREQTETLKVN